MSLRASVARTLWRVAAKVGGARAVYGGAQGGRLMADWIWGPISAQGELMDLRTLRDRGRELERDNAYAGRYVELCSENIISDTGLRLQAMTYTGPSTAATLNDRVNDEIERAWAEFSEPECGDVRGLLSQLDLQRLVVERWKGGDGEALIQLLPGSGAHGLQWNILDADQLDETLWRARSSTERDGPDVNAIVAGVEVDRQNKPVAYHLWSDHPSDLLGRRARVRVDAAQIIHLFTANRPGQTRGITRFARVMKALRHLGGLNEAVLVNMRASACKMGFLQPGPDAEPLVDGDGKPRISFEATPGTIDVLPRDHTFADWNPNQPTASHREVVHEALYEISAGLGVAFVSLTGNLTAANYGSQRGGLLAERRGWRRDQQYVAKHLQSRLYLAWLKHASLARAVQLPSADYTKWASHEWLFPGWPWIDPAKDIDAGLAEVRAGLNSLTGLAAASGRDFEVILALRQKEQRLALKYGVTIDLSSTGTPPQETTNATGNATEGTGTAGEADAGDGTGDRAAPRLRLARGV